MTLVQKEVKKIMMRPWWVEKQIRPSTIPLNWLLAHYKFNNSLADDLWNYNLTQWAAPTYITWKDWNAISAWYWYATLPIWSTFTIRFFLKWNTSTDWAIWIFTSLSDWKSRIDVMRNDSWTTNFFWWDSGWNSYTWVTYSWTSVWDNNWHHIVATKTWTAWQLFVDGNKYTWTLPSISPTILTIKHKDRPNSNIAVDDVLVYDRVWTDAEVANDYTNVFNS